MPNDTTPPATGDVRELAQWLTDNVTVYPDGYGISTHPEMGARILEAAAALERLAGDRDGVEFLHGFEMAKLRLERDAERAARERVEAALREIAAGDMGEGYPHRDEAGRPTNTGTGWGYISTNYDDCFEAGVAAGLWDAAQLARAALQPQPQPQGDGA